MTDINSIAATVANPNVAQPAVTTPAVTPLTGYTPDPTGVYSASNLTGLVTAPATKPDLSDPYGLRAQFMNSPDLVAARKASQDTFAKLNSFDTNGETLQNKLQGQQVSLNTIRGEQSQTAQQLSTERSGIARELQTSQANYDTLANEANSNYQIALNERTNLQSLIQQTGGKAGIAYGDTFESALQKADTYMTQKAQDEKDQAYKDSIKQMALSMGISTSGRSSGEIAKKIAKQNKSAVDNAQRTSDLQYQITLSNWNASKQKMVAAQSGGTGSGLDVAGLFGDSGSSNGAGYDYSTSAQQTSSIPSYITNYLGN